jgi:nucleoid DNA-binding protein
VDKATLLQRLAEKLDVPVNQAERIMAVVAEAFRQSLAWGDKVRLKGFGTFGTRTGSENISRECENPSPFVNENNVGPYFKPARSLKQKALRFLAVSYSDAPRVMKRKSSSPKVNDLELEQRVEETVQRFRKFGLRTPAEMIEEAEKILSKKLVRTQGRKPSTAAGDRATLLDLLGMTKSNRSH